MKKNKIIAIAAMAATVAVIFILSWFIDREPAPISRTEFALDTVCTVTVYNVRGDKNKILDEVFDLCAKYERLLSTTVSDSDIYKINHSGGKPTTVNPETATLISDALEYCRLSDGAFDITILPVKNLWNFSGEASEIPTSDELSAALKYVDYTKISVDNCVVTIPDGMGIDLGAIAKGFVADRIADCLIKNNVNSAIIDLGGNIYTIGSKSDGSSWRVGIQKPFSQGGEYLYVAQISNASAVTSGVYQRYFKQDGKIYHHILDAKDGLPCDTGLYSVTVISDNSQQCDALSTMCMLLGYERSIELLTTKFHGISAVFITSDYQVLEFNI